MNIVSEEQQALFIQSYCANYDRLLLIAKCLLENPHIAEEIVQETFIIAWTCIDKFEENDYSIGWLYNALRNRIRNWSREKENFLKRVEFIADINGESYDEEHILLTYKGLIPEKELRLLYRRIVLQKSYKQLAKELNISLSACKMRVARAKEHFRKAYLKELEEDT